MQQFIDEEEKGIFMEYLLFLEQNELGFFTNKPGSFPEIDKKQLSSNIISNAIFDFMKDIQYNLEGHLLELETLGCEAVQVRFFENPEQAIFGKLLESFKEPAFRCVEFLMNADEMYNEKYLKKILRANPAVNAIVLYGSSRDGFIPLNHYQSLELKTSSLEKREQCGQMGAKYFNANLSHVIESHNYNSCLNKKISIDENGDIKNCPSLNPAFGNARDVSLTEALEKRGFKDFWNLGKDKVEVCKDCEFRYICTDCRAYTQDPNDKYSKPIKCGYDPYSNIWEDWSINSLSKVANSS